MQLFDLSEQAHAEDCELQDSVHDMRAQCTRKMGQILHQAELWSRHGGGSAIMDEHGGINSMLFMEWVSRKHTGFFMKTGYALISCACVLLHVRGPGKMSESGAHDDKDEHEQGLAALYHAMALCVFDTGILHHAPEIQKHTVFLRGLAATQYRGIDISLFLDFYHPSEPHTKQRLIEFLFSHIKENPGRPRHSMYHNFVEIAIRESDDMEARHEIFFDYALLKSGGQSHASTAR
jgi:hypothetical protein